MRRITLWLLLVAAFLGPVRLVSAEKTGLPLRDDVVAVVLSGLGKPTGTLTISYPNNVPRTQIEQDLGIIQQASSWRFSPPGITKHKDETQATAVMRDTAPANAPPANPVWPVVLALKRFNRITVALMGSTYTGGVGPVSTPYVEGQWSGQGSFRCCDLTVKDRSFETLQQLAAQPKVGARASTDDREPLQRSRGWYILIVVALSFSVAAYIAAVRHARR